MKKNIIHKYFLLLQGGLGNQLFEIFYATALVLFENRNKTVNILTKFLSKYSTPRNLEVYPLLKSNLVNYELTEANSFANLRLAKIVSKILKRDLPISIPYLGTFLDGYYQHVQNYNKFDQEIISKIINEWRQILLSSGVIKFIQFEVISHIRLGDFFSSRELAYNFLIKRFESLPVGSDIITDDEDLIREFLVEKGLNQNYKIITTNGFDAWEVLALMTSYKKIYTNGSTLAFWACALSGGDLISTNFDHNSLINLFRKI